MVSYSELYDFIMLSSSTYLNTILSNIVLLQNYYILMPFYCYIVNFSFYTSNLPTMFKHALVIVRLNKSNLDYSNVLN